MTTTDRPPPPNGSPAGLLPADWRRDPVAAGILLASATATREARELAHGGTVGPGTAQTKLYYWPHPGSLFRSSMIDPAGTPLVHGPGASAFYGYGPGGGPPIASNSAVFACLAVIAKAYQEAPLRVFRKQRDGKQAWLDTHPFQAVVDDPHPSLTPFEVHWWVQVCKHVHGDAFLRKVRAGAGNPVELWPLSPMRVQPVTTKSDRAAGVFISYYRYEYEPAKFEEILPEDIVHFRLGIDDADHRRGCSPLQRLIREVSTDEEATAFTAALLRNTGTAGLIVTTPPGVTMTKEDAETLKARIDAAFNGPHRGSTGVLTSGATLAQVGFDPQRMDLKTVHRIPEERIAAVLGVHPMVAGLGAGLERSTFSNFREAREALFEQTVLPLYAADAATWQKHLLRPDFDQDPAVHCAYDTADLRALQEDTSAIYARLTEAVKAKWVLPDEARSEVGLPPLPDGSGMAIIQEAPPALPAPGDEEDEGGGGQEQRARLPAAQRKALGLDAFPALWDAMHDLAVPALERDLAGYYAGQRARVQRRLRSRG